MKDRKRDHINLAFKSQIDATEADSRFYYEPFLSSHDVKRDFPIEIAGKKMRFPIWVSSMTGGTERALSINLNLAKACNEFGLGMGLGSCRALLEDNKYFPDFDMRDLIGDDAPFFANLGIAQIEKEIANGTIARVEELIKRLRTDGLIIHVNPLQEWIQPGGDRLLKPPIETITRFLEKFNFPVIVKEVGQGFGPESMKSLLRLPLEAIEFGAFGGTNFSTIEQLRRTGDEELYGPFTKVGHSAVEMVDFLNTIINDGVENNVKTIIISGGIKNFLDGYFLLNKINIPTVYGQASSFLKNAMEDYSGLSKYVSNQISGFQMANAFLKVR